MTKRSDRQKLCDKMLKEALAQPGVREAEEVYSNWQDKERRFSSSYPTALDKSESISRASSKSTLD